MAEPTPSERFEELQRQVNQRVQQALAELRQEFGERLRKAGDQIVGELGREIEGVSPELPASFLSADELAPLAAEAEERAQREAHGRLTAALAAVDRAGSQAEVLRVLAGEARRFADRSAVFLTREDGLELWDSAGWGEGDGAAEKIALPFAERGPWSHGALESGAAELSAAEAANLCDRIGEDPAAAAALVPLVLRDRLAAVLYADVESSGALQLEALQTLTYTAALALETLPFRERASTPTLGLAGTAAATPAERQAAEPPPAIAVEPAEPEAAPQEDVPTAAEPPPPFSAEEEEEVEIEVEEKAEDVEDAAAGGWTLEDEPAVGEAGAGEGPQAEVGELEVSEPEELEIGGEPPAFETDFEGDLEVDLDADVELETDLDSEDLAAGEIESGPEAEIEVEEPEIEEPAVDEPAAEEPAAAEPEGEELESEEEPASPAATAGFEAPSPRPAPGEPPAPPPEPTPPSPPGEAAPAGGSQVAPPSDLEGPGRAFGGAAAEEPVSDDEARHEEARRLARLLVSEIRLYNEEEVEEGRRNNDIYQRLKEDIDRSRQMYDERVDPAIRDSTDYFYQELVRNLGGGDAATLGI